VHLHQRGGDGVGPDGHPEQQHPDHWGHPAWVHALHGRLDVHVCDLRDSLMFVHGYLNAGAYSTGAQEQEQRRSRPHQAATAQPSEGGEHTRAAARQICL
jgi:hypothetical protein